MKEDILRIQRLRFMFLYEIYKRLGGKSGPSYTVDYMTIYKMTDEWEYIAGEIASYLDEENLTDRDYSNSLLISLTHKGLKTVEFIITHPDKHTNDFPSFNAMGL